MARYSDLLPDIRSACREAPEPAMERTIRKAVIEFCRQGRAWREAVEIPLEAGKSAYQMRIRPEGRCAQIIRAAYVTERSRRTINQAVFSQIAVPPHNRQESEPQRFGLDSGMKEIHLFPTPGGSTFLNQTDPRLELYLVAVPQLSSRQFPDQIADLWAEQIVHGALWKMLVQPSKPWTNHALAEFHRRQFFIGVTEARQQAESEGWTPGHSKIPRWV